MLKTILTSVVFLFTLHTNSQSKITDFLTKIVGSYKGDLEIVSPRGKQTAPMEFQLYKTDTVAQFDCRLIYNGNPRNYTLVVKDDENGLLEIDEDNRIILPTRHFDNSLFSFFEVQNNFLSIRLQFEGNQLFFEYLFSDTKNKITTGGQSKSIPEVSGFLISKIHRAILVKQKD